MSDDAAHEWLTVAATELAHMGPATLAAACREARKTCTHHGQIVPAILASDAAKSHRQHQALLGTLGGGRNGGARQIGHVAREVIEAR